MVFAVAKEVLRGSEYRVEAMKEEYMGDNLDSDAKQIILKDTGDRG